MKRWARVAGACAFVLLLLVVGARQLASDPRRVANPLAQLVHDAVDRAPITGRVEQRLEAGSYTYLALRVDQAGPSARAQSQGEPLWAVTMGQGAPPGAHIVLRSMGHSTDFYSRRLQRTFPELVFGIVSRD